VLVLSVACGGVWFVDVLYYISGSVEVTFIVVYECTIVANAQYDGHRAGYM